MMKDYLLHEVDKAWRRWQSEFERLEIPGQLEDYQRRRIEFFIQAIGGLPERTPLNARVTGVLRREKYRVEKILFESQPCHYVTGNLFLPNSALSKIPGVLVPCGHIEIGKAHDEYQSMGALLALNGMAALVYDPIDQGERGQLLDEAGKTLLPGTSGHMMSGVGGILLGRNTARYEIWDGMRAIDYLQSRPEIDPERIGCTGNSGGGTQTSYLMALDERIRVAAVSCYLHTLARQLASSTGDAEQNIFGQLEFGLEHADYILMRAPRPVLVCAATKDFFDINAVWEMFRYVKRAYTRLGHAERVDILENNAEHNYNRTQREGVARWMARWLLETDKPIAEPPLKLFSEHELHCAPYGQVMRIEGARSVYDLNEDYARELAEKRRSLWASLSPDEMREKIRRIAGIRHSSELPEPAIETIVALNPGTSGKSVVLCIHEAGIEAARQEELFKTRAGEGHAIFGIEVRGTGATQQKEQTAFGPAIGLDWEDYFKAYSLGRSFVGMRAEDILLCAKRLFGNHALELMTWGNVGIPALHAAALEPELFDKIHVTRSLISWSNVIESKTSFNQLINAVHGALTTYDLPDLAGMLEGRIVIEHPVDAHGNEVTK